MRYVFLILLIFGCYFVQAQQKPKQGKKIDTKNTKEGEAPAVSSHRTYPDNRDNMPVVVPDMTQLAPMPNGISPTAKTLFIPNGYGYTPIVIPVPPKRLKKAPK